jgi:hypothetical protein
MGKYKQTFELSTHLALADNEGVSGVRQRLFRLHTVIKNFLKSICEIAP